jgi:hypothetical protein
VSAIKKWWVFAAFVSGLALAMVAEELIVNWHNDRLEFSLSHVHFLAAGKPLELLHNAAPVPFDFQMTVYAGSKSHVLQQVTDQFVVSYALWEENFKVVKMQSPRRQREHLSAAEAEKWCVDQMAMDLPSLAPNTPLWARFEIRAEDGKDGPLFGRGSIGDSGLSLTSLIEVFSRPARSQQSHWGPYEAGPFTVEDLKRSSRRGS